MLRFHATTAVAPSGAAAVAVWKLRILTCGANILKFTFVKSLRFKCKKVYFRTRSTTAQHLVYARRADTARHRAHGASPIGCQSVRITRPDTHIYMAPTVHRARASRRTLRIAVRVPNRRASRVAYVRAHTDTHTYTWRAARKPTAYVSPDASVPGPLVRK